MEEEDIYVNVPRKARQFKDFEVEAPQRRPKVTVKKVAVAVVIVLLVIALVSCVGVIVHQNRASKSNTNTMAETTTVSVNSTGIKTTPNEMTTVRPCVVRCAAGWKFNGTKCYYFSSNKLTWTKSRDMCRSLSGDLVKIESREEQKFLHTELPSVGWFWIGLTDSETEGQWKWTDGSPLDPSLTFWWEEPDDWKGPNAEFPEGEDCAIIIHEDWLRQENIWADVYCGNPQKFICEKESTYLLQ